MSDPCQKSGSTSSSTIRRVLRAVLFCRRDAAHSSLLRARRPNAPTSSIPRMGPLAFNLSVEERGNVMWRPWLSTLAAVLLISQSAFAQGTKVEVTVSTNPRDECATKVRLIGGAPVNFTVAKTGKVVQLTQPYTCLCISQKGEVTTSSCPDSLVQFEFSPAAAISPITQPVVTSPTQPPL